MYKLNIHDKRYFKVCKNKKLWNSPILKIKEKNIIKINFNYLVNFQKFSEGINFNINHRSSFLLVSPNLAIAKERLQVQNLRKN
jgi:hypothetical protein